MSETEKKDDKKINTRNLFDEFEVDEETRSDINELEKAINKDLYYYVTKVWTAFKMVNYSLFLLICVFSFYIFIQNSSSNFLKDQQYLWPFCNILNWNNNFADKCSSLALSTKKIDSYIEKLQTTYLKSMISILEKTYEIDNVQNSKEAIFIIDKYKNKNDPYAILNEFDRIKNKFTSIDKKKIQCIDIVIKENIFKAKCSAFSTQWYDSIPWWDWDIVNTIEWTSITLASSFINYLSKKQNIKLLEKQKIFDSNTYFWWGNYTYKTDFTVKFEYLNNDLSL
jgi:hypothetical protein